MLSHPAASCRPLPVAPAFRLTLAAALALLLTALTPLLRAAAPVSLFDGKSLAGWEGDEKWWRVQDGALTGGSTTEKVPKNFFLATTRSFQNFDLRLKLKLTGVPNTGMINSGVQIRSLRVPDHTEMSGYQVDAGDGWWGKLYDESRRNKVIAVPADLAAVDAAVRKNDWNDYRILAEGPRLRTWLNGVPALDYTETDPAIALDGKIALQIHSGGIALVQIKDVVIEELPPTPGAPTWDKVGHPKPRPPAPAKKKQKTAAATPPAGGGAVSGATAATVAAPAPTGAAAPAGRNISYNAVADGPRSPADQLAAFTVPPGFEVELVAAESPGIGKFITVDWDARFRLWSVTALEYPVDANENKAASDALFARGGRDRVVVFDTPYAAPAAPGAPAVTAPPRTFADGLVMPLGVMPYRDGAYVQYGADVRFYRDTDADGRADRHEVILTGFGTQDSHLFPHQFLRQPGGDFFLAQGLFNYSTVRRPGDAPFADGRTAIPFNQCKLARVALDGSAFESVTAGPNNIWGLVTARDGETFFQEANDMGYPVIPYAPGVHVRTGSREKLRPYQPLMPPPLPPAQMGGTGLSGLALAEDLDSPFARTFPASAPSPITAGPSPAAKIFFLANPITGAINTVRGVADPATGRYRFEKLADLVTTTDRWFRPVAVHFGPDGALYIVDWYNKIISHNEVPREHPDRDKARGRIWRVRHRDQPRVTPPDLAAASDTALLAHLGAPNALVARRAWLELADRRAVSVAPQLAALAADSAAAVDRRLGALWALEGIQTVDTALLRTLAAAPSAHLRREAARLACLQPRPEAELFSIVSRLTDDPAPAVRAALGDGLRRLRSATPGLIALAAALGRAPLADGDEWTRYERDFDRFLARWALETHPDATRALLASPAARILPAENRALAALALGGPDGAARFAALRPQLDRALTAEEVRLLAEHAALPAVRPVLAPELAAPASRPALLRALLELRSSLDTSALAAPLADAALAQLAAPASADQALGAEIAGAFRLAAAVPALDDLVRARWREAKNPAVPAALRALRDLAAGDLAVLETVARDSTDAPVRDDALAALAAHAAPAAPVRLVALLPALPATPRGLALYRLAGTPAGAAALVAGWRAGTVAGTDLGLSTVDKLRAVLPDDPSIRSLWEKLGGDAPRVLRLEGADSDYVATQLNLPGPFTVECWAKLEGPLSNRTGLLAGRGQLDLNFHAGKFRAWVGGGVGDIVVSAKPTVPGVWIHYAVTRDAAGTWRLFRNGELDATSTTKHTGPLTGLDIGRTNPTAGGTRGWLAEFRVWNVARGARDLRENFDRSFAAEPAAARPAALRHVFAGSSWGPLQGAARLEPAADAPVLLTPAEAAAQAEKFARFRTLANTRGNPERGRELFAALCLTCHQQGGQGGNLAPALDGVGHTGVEAILRNILTPSAAMESAYQTFRLTLVDGSVVDAFLVEQTADAFLLRIPGGSDRRIPKNDVRSSGYLRRSLMPEGLLDALPSEAVSDLFAHLKSLR